MSADEPAARERVADRSWTVAPTLAWLTVLHAGAQLVIDGNVSALADRLTTKRADQPAGPAATVHTANAAEIDDTDIVAPLPPAPAGSHDIGALDDVCIDGTDAHCTTWAMDGFYRAIAASRKGTLGRAVRVSWYGDSVVATDDLPGRLRTRLQGELGDGGPGFLYIVPPHRFCQHTAVTRTGGDNWLSFAVSMSHAGDHFYGPAGASVETTNASSGFKLASGTASIAELYYLAQPTGGTATVTADGAEIVKVATAADAKAPGWSVGTAAKGAKKFEVSAKGKTRLFGISLENPTGAVVDNFGIVSVHVKSYATADPAHWTTQLAHRSADLVMIMIGANEAHWLGPKDAATKDYQGHYEKLLAPIRKARPDATCLVVSPSDQAEAKDDAYVSRPIIPVLVAAQRKAAHAQGCAFFSTYEWMGGKGSAARWFKKHLVSSDFTHLSKQGANKLSDAVFDALMTGAKRYASK